MTIRPVPAHESLLAALRSKQVEPTPGQVRTRALRGRSVAARMLLASQAFAADPADVIAADVSAELADDLKDPRAAFTLALVLGTQPLRPDDRRRALDLYDLLAHKCGLEIIASEHQSMHAQLMYACGESQRLHKALQDYANLPPLIRRALEAELAFPENGGSPETFLQRFQVFAGWEDLTLYLEEGDGPLLDRIRFTGQRTVTGGQLISVVMTCHAPGQELVTAVRSVMDQTWENWELLLVDDASGPSYGDFLHEVEALDPRVRLFRCSENGGTYRARNLALEHARGVFITGLDSDDWAHPRWLESQVEPLTQIKGAVMTVSEGIRATGDLRTVLSPGARLTEARSTSIMYRRAEVFPALGFFDTTRKAADSEFRFRLAAHFGPRAVRNVPGLHTIVRKHQRSLSHAEIAEGWLSPARYAYESAFRHWHATIADRTGDAFLPARPTERKFYAPPSLSDGEPAPSRVQRLYVADWSRDDDLQAAMLRVVDDSLAQGKSVALAHAPSWETLADAWPRLSGPAVAKAREHAIEFVALGSVTADATYFADDLTRMAAMAETPAADFGATEVFALPEPATEPKGEQSAAPTPERPAGSNRTRLPSVLTKDGKLLVAAATAAMVSGTVTGAVIGIDQPIGIAVFGLGASLGLGTLIEVVRQMKQRIYGWL